jgi:hypothetical protein
MPSPRDYNRWLAGVCGAGVLIAGSLLGVAPAAAETITLHGMCISVVIAGKPARRTCDGKLAILRDNRDRSAFMFTFMDGTFLAFEGALSKAVQVNGGLNQPILDVVNLNLGSPPVKTSISGSCGFGGGRVVQVTCASAAGDFKVVFVSDGLPLEIVK